MVSSLYTWVGMNFGTAGLRNRGNTLDKIDFHENHSKKTNINRTINANFYVQP